LAVVIISSPISSARGIGWLHLVDSKNFRSLLQKSPIKETIFCKRDLKYFAKETYNFKEPNNRSHHILACQYDMRHSHVNEVPIRHKYSYANKTFVCEYDIHVWMSCVTGFIGMPIRQMTHRMPNTTYHNSPPKNGVIALWPNTRVVKCKYYVSQKPNGLNTKIPTYRMPIPHITTHSYVNELCDRSYWHAVSVTYLAEYRLFRRALLQKRPMSLRHAVSVTCRIHVCDRTYPRVWHDSLVSCIGDMTSNVWNNSFKRSIWLIYLNGTYSKVVWGGFD